MNFRKPPSNFKTLYRFNALLTWSFLWLPLLGGLSGCASKKHRVVEVPMPPPATQPQTPAVPALEPSPPATEPTTKPPAEKLRVGLVLGGAGVASFATVGLLKRLQQEDIRIDFIVTTGWPTLFSLGYGFMKSVHDLEWFAMRLQEKDFYSAGLFDLTREYASHDKLSALIDNAFPQRDISESRLPIIISAANTEPGDPELYEKGDWKTPLLKTMSVPGIYRPYPQGKDRQWISSLQGIDVGEATRRNPDIIVAVEMYEDYFTFLKKGTGTKNGSEALFRQLYLTQLRNTIGREFKLAHVTGHIQLNKTPNDFTAKRMAILEGYKEGTRLVKEIRKQLHD